MGLGHWDYRIFLAIIPSPYRSQILNLQVLLPFIFSLFSFRTFETTSQIPEGVTMSLLNAEATSVFEEAHIHRLGDTVSLVLTLDTNGNGIRKNKITQIIS